MTEKPHIPTLRAIAEAAFEIAEDKALLRSPPVEVLRAFGSAVSELLDAVAASLSSPTAEPGGERGCANRWHVRVSGPNEACAPGGEAETLAAFCDEAALYFEKRDTRGEDMAHWSNVSNAENARKAAAFIRRAGILLAQRAEAAKPREAVSRVEVLERVLREADRAITDTLDYRGKPVEQLRMAQTEIDKLNLYTTAARKKG